MSVGNIDPGQAVYAQDEVCVIVKFGTGQSADRTEWKTVHYCSVGVISVLLYHHSGIDNIVNRERKSEHMD